MTFEAAVRDSPELSDHFRHGLQALKRGDRAGISIQDPRRLTGSIDMDRALRPHRPQDPIWDYGVGVRQATNHHHAIWIEPHPASSNHVEEVVAKLGWLRSWLREYAPALEGMSRHYVWLATGRVALPPNSPKRRLIAQRGIEFRARTVDVDELIAAR